MFSSSSIGWQLIKHLFKILNQYMYTLPQTNTNLMIVPLSKDNVLIANESGVVSVIEIGHYSLQ